MSSRLPKKPWISCCEWMQICAAVSAEVKFSASEGLPEPTTMNRC